jgi:hypothetical protein
MTRYWVELDEADEAEVRHWLWANATSWGVLGPQLVEIGLRTLRLAAESGVRDAESVIAELRQEAMTRAQDAMDAARSDAYAAEAESDAAAEAEQQAGPY